MCVCMCAHRDVCTNTETFEQAKKHLQKLTDMGTKWEMSAQTWRYAHKLRVVYTNSNTELYTPTNALLYTIKY